jgi:anti-sigma regulatory factor (Ser/Thr protein kinase)
MRADVLALDLPMSVAAPGLARRAIEELGLEAGERESASLVISELVTNAVLHSGAAVTTSIRITARIIGDMLRLSVTDGGTRAGAICRRETAGIEGGFGLLLVERLVARWGVERNGTTTVWCELPVGNRGPAEAAADRQGEPHPRLNTSLQRRVPSA